MAAPWCIEFYEDIFVLIENDVLVVMRDDDLDWALLLFGDGLRLDTWLHLPVDKVLYELADFVMGERLALVEGELLVLNSLLDRKGGPFAGLQVQIISVSSEGLGVNSGEADSSLVLFRKGLKGLGEFFALLKGFGEDVGQWNAGLRHARQWYT